MRDFVLPHIFREEEKNLQVALRTDSNSKSIIIYGNSGTGKTSIISDEICKLIKSEKQKDYLILSINIVDDNITPSYFFELLIFLLWNGNIHDCNSLINIERKDSFSKFLKSKIKHKKISKALFYSVQTAVSMIPTYGAQISNFMNNVNTINYSYSIDKSDLLQKYLKKISKKKKVIFLIDNYQFMLPNIRLQFESIIEMCNKNLLLVSIFRTDDSFVSHPPLCFSSNRVEIGLSNFSFEQTKEIIYKLYGESNFHKRVAEDCYSKTSGNPKEIELYIRRNKNAILNKSLQIGKTDTLKNTLYNLPDIQRFLVILSTLFPAGIKIDYLYSFVSKQYITDESSLEIELRKLITLGYVIINSKNHNLLKPSHDKIGININKIRNDEDFIELYKCVEETLEELILLKNRDKDYIYLLHCLIGVCGFKDLQRNINYLVDLISIEYNNCAYYYITEIISQEKEIITFLPKTSINQLLDSCQKCSEFSFGLEICDQFSNDGEHDNKYAIYAIKFLTQMYDFEQALSLIDNTYNSNETLVYKLNILQHQGKDDEAKLLINQSIDTINKDKWYYIMLRNSAHYFPYDKAEENLNNCLEYFKKYGTTFEIATVYNNLSVIQIWNGKKTFSTAKTNLKKSISKHNSINSNEIFEPYCNYSVLLFLEKNYADSLTYASLALEELPHRLELDVIILSINKLIIEYVNNLIPLSKLYEELTNYYDRPIINKDPWVKFQVAFNLYNIELAYKGKTDIEFDEYFVNKQKKCTGFEVFTKIENMNISLSLSPNWRY